ncbi:MAG: phage tail sheath family protein, partial [Acidimicrobiia bacterium]
MPTYLSPGVYVEELEAGSRPIEGVGTAVAAFLGLASRGPVNTPTLVTNWSQFTTAFGESMEGSYLAHAVYGYLLNGGGACYVVRVGGNGGGPSAKAELTAGEDAGGTTFQILALEGGAAGNDITVEVTDPGEGAPDDTFKLVVKKAGTVVEEHDKVTAKAGKTNVITVVNAASKLIRLEKAGSGGALAAPAKGSVQLAGGGGPSALAPEDYVGDASQRTGLGALEAVDAVTMVCAPDLMAAYQMGMIDLDGVQAVQGAIIAHCEQMGDRVAVLDPPPGLNAQQLLE